MQAIAQAFIRYFSQVRPTAALFPVVLAALIAVFFFKYKREMAPRMGTLEWIQNFDKPRFSLDGKGYSMERRDLLPVIVILAVYAVVAFTNLGSTKDPQSFYTFEGENDSVVIDLGEQKEISSIMYYTGLYPGDYDLYYSSNGSNWIRLKDTTAQEDESGAINDAAMHQSYADLFKWQYASIGDTMIKTR